MVQSIPAVERNVVNDMYEENITSARCVAGTTEGFSVKVGLHKGSALSPVLFALVMDRLIDGIRKESPWIMMLADYVVLCCRSRENVETQLGRWRDALVRRDETEYSCLNRDGKDTST